MSWLSWLFTGGALPFFLLLCGAFFFLYLRGRPLTRPRGMLRALARPSQGGISPFRAVTLALAGTLGVGNIVGVANAIAVGGAGAIFWMWVSALAAMLLKYAEILLAVLHRRVGRDGGFFGGAIYYIRDLFFSRGLHRAGAILSGLFALLMILNSLCMGCVIQVNAVSSALFGVFSIPKPITGLILLAITLPVILRGVKGISALTEYLVPIMSLGYILLSAAVLILRRDRLGDVFASIFSEAFSPTSAVGGVLGFLTARSLRVGTLRGLLSNEAGCGTAPTAHACAATDSPASQGVWGIFEVFADTILLCTATALVILSSAPNGVLSGVDGVMLTLRAYSSALGGWSDWFFCVALLCFGYATVICWASYGAESLRAITHKPLWRMLYVVVFLICIPVGATTAPGAIWTLADVTITALTTVNLCMLLAMRREIRRETLLAFPTRPRKRKKTVDERDAA